MGEEGEGGWRREGRRVSFSEALGVCISHLYTLDQSSGVVFVCERMGEVIDRRCILSFEWQIVFIVRGVQEHIVYVRVHHSWKSDLIEYKLSLSSLGRRRRQGSPTRQSATEVLPSEIDVMRFLPYFLSHPRSSQTVTSAETRSSS